MGVDEVIEALHELNDQELDRVRQACMFHINKTSEIEILESKSKEVFQSVLESMESVGIRVNRHNLGKRAKPAALVAVNEITKVFDEHRMGKFARAKLIRMMVKHQARIIRDCEREPTSSEIWERLRDPKAIIEDVLPNYMGSGLLRNVLNS